MLFQKEHIYNLIYILTSMLLKLTYAFASFLADASCNIGLFLCCIYIAVQKYFGVLFSKYFYSAWMHLIDYKLQ